ncbi:HPr family phosphocarrier protein [Mechercharimyces sp. CAU 1602]|uniref:HPr family phosphocarrier protein n=1 Tax=Mechercharimyces sp. CAU 1602 TaxID=2973933 RepID=UPI0021620AE6|nr:HPr family phosphocarrier protein [Mechercharimyces sp. CAU 1602]MCS1350004.1 HPr family phosphocarrier protein [Mechercharimyces sp. CAU 1602]
MEKRMDLTLRSPMQMTHLLYLSQKLVQVESDIQFVKEGVTCNGKSILGVISFFLSMKKGELFTLLVEGSDAGAVCNQLEEWFAQRQEAEPDQWEQEGTEQVLEAWREAGSKWTPSVRMVAKSYFRSG